MLIVALRRCSRLKLRLLQCFLGGFSRVVVVDGRVELGGTRGT
jgi:hypothetical protein